MTLRETVMQAPFGPLVVSEEGGAITRIRWGRVPAAEAQEGNGSPLLAEARSQLSAYFAGGLEVFDLPLAPGGSAFQKEFYRILSAIPYGETRRYGEIAAEMGAPAQAIGQACGGNPIPIFIPCHRVLAANGLGGYSGGAGVETKVELLKLERAAGLLI